MKLRALVIALVLAHSSQALSMDDQTAVVEAIDAYKKALIDGDGRSASALMSAESQTLLRSGVGRALSITASELRDLPSIDQLVVLLLRHSLDAEHLRKMNEKDPVEYVVSVHAFNIPEIAKAEVDEIFVEGGEAEAYLLHAQNFPPDAAIFLKKEAGSWRIDLVQYLGQFMPVGVIYNPNTIDETNDIETQIMSSTIAWITGRAPDENIWNPPG